MATMTEGEQDVVETERTVTLPEQGDTSRPAPVKVMLVGGPLDGKVITAPVEATHVAFWVYKKPTRKSPRPEEYGTDKTMQVRYQVHPLIGNTETWYIGRITGMKFDAAINKIMEKYHASS